MARSAVLTLLSTYFTVLYLVLGAPTWNMVVHEERTSVPAGFSVSEANVSEQKIDLEILLIPKDFPGLEDTLYAISTPGNPRYGKHLSFEEVKSFMRPPPDATTTVVQWLSDHGINSTIDGSFEHRVKFSIPVTQANHLLDANFQRFTHTSTRSPIIRTLKYSVPQSLRSRIAATHPTTTFAVGFGGVHTVQPTPKAANASSNAGSASCDDQVTPACLQDLYGMPTNPATETTNGIAVPGFLEQFAQQADLDLFLDNFRTDIRDAQARTFKLRTIDDGRNPQGDENAGLEANLDIQYTVGLATAVPVTFVSVGRSDTSGFLDLFNSLAQDDNPPSVLSVSYSFDEGDVSPRVARVICESVATLGAKGVSVIFASGDGGVGGSRPSDRCWSFEPTFPSGCPYMTSVGATRRTREEAADLSNGGFSNIFSRPNYQDEAVARYLQDLGPRYSGRYHRSGRAFPDVSAQGENIVMINAGEALLVEGTSASAPIFASIIALINDQLISARGSTLGFLNPFLYSNTHAFNDIATGSNPSCRTEGFPATSGWDPVTGLGTPKFDALLDAAKRAQGLDP